MRQLPTPRQSPRISPCVAAGALLVAAFLLAAPCAAQTPAKKGAAYVPSAPTLNWEVTLGGAGGFGVSKGDIDAAFAKAGYAPSTSGDFLSATFYPAVRFRIGERAAIGASFSSTRLGSTTATGSGTSVTIQRSSADLALVAFWMPTAGVRLGAGPAWYRLTASPSGGEHIEVSRLGWVAEAGLAFPEGSRWYGDLAVQYRGAGSADFGSYAPPAKGRLAPAPISLDGIGCSHAAFLAGIGVRF